MACTPTSTSSSTTTVTRSIRPHRKSRTGCRTCKRRKVKCDEQQPCGNCKSFGVACDLAPEAFTHAPNPADSVKRRGRGRPRKNWGLDTDKLTIRNGCLSSRATPSLDSSASTPSTLSQASEEDSLNINQAELLLQFITHTSATLAGEGGMMGFWSQNAPRISLDHPFVLHLIVALAAYHLSHGTVDDKGTKPTSLHPRRNRSEYLSLASRHFTAGLSGFTAQLSHPGADNCGALYLGAVLTTYCTFASGPTSPDDLLVCTIAPSTAEDQDSNDDPTVTEPCTWMPFVYGVRLLHDSFSPSVLFAGLMEPLKPYKDASPEELMVEPVCVRDGFQRLDWEPACRRLTDWVGDVENDPCRLAMDSLLPIYAATYGYSEADGRIRYDGASVNQYVFGWLYRLDNAFLQCVRRREPRALLVLAYYAVLLNKNTVQGGWYIEGWRSHMIDRVRKMLGESEGRQFMEWPEEVVGDNG